MNTQKTSSHGRLLAFFLIALALVLIFGFAASGSNSNGGAMADNSDDNSDKDDNNTDSEENGEGEEQDSSLTPTPPKYLNYLTGLLESDISSQRKPVSFIMSTEAALYGISSAELLIEIPIENGKTRMLAFSTSLTGLGKIGSIAPTRAYITGLAKSFGSTLVSYGRDDTKVYPEISAPPENLDLSKNTGYHYTEYTKFAYSNSDLINRGLANSSLGLSPPDARLPFDFANEGNAPTTAGVSATWITLPYSPAGATELTYSEHDGTYTIAKGPTVLYDMLTGSTPTYKNAIVLFADSVTYESCDSVSFIMDTISGGSGIYATDGRAINIRWECNESGEMSFFTETGERLSVNRGKTYIGFFKSSMADSVTLR